MEDTETKLCSNCKREIPYVNFTTHNVHCARNIRICPVCKEPVPHNELQDHHDKLHKLQPCHKCGESVCGTDMEDHVRDSCAHTIKSCRLEIYIFLAIYQRTLYLYDTKRSLRPPKTIFCELELPRRDLPAHENYCGVRTEQCPECREWVMIKYRQLHLDSNHGFLRLDDDPTPIPNKEPQKTKVPIITKITDLPAPSGSGLASSRLENRLNGYVKNTNGKPPTENRFLNQPSTSGTSSLDIGNGEGTSSHWRSSRQINGFAAPTKRTNDQPQINTNVETMNKVEKKIGVSRGAVKKRPAPRPPIDPPIADPRRDMPFYSALQRQQEEERKRQEQTAYNLSVGLPPVLSPAAKLEKLRKMDALQNPDTSVDYKNRLKGRVWHSPEHESSHVGYVLGSDKDLRRKEDFKNLKPMTPQEFMQRFTELQVGKDEELERKKISDRFSEIKSSLRELRRGLNEVTAPYNSNASASNNNGDQRTSPVPHDEVQLPCEFCGSLVSANDLVQHQTGCRPDLAQLITRPGRADNSGLPNVISSEPDSRVRVARQNSYEDPVIPCEFCTESLPVYLISEHQERCGRETNLLYPD